MFLQKKCLLGRNPVELKSQIKSKLDDAQVRASVKKPPYIDDVVQLYKAKWNPAKNYQPEIAGTVAAQKGASNDNRLIRKTCK